MYRYCGFRMLWPRFVMICSGETRNSFSVSTQIQNATMKAINANNEPRIERAPPTPMIRIDIALQIVDIHSGAMNRELSERHNT